MDPLLAKAFRGLVLTLLAFGAILFGGVWALDWWQAWLFLAAFSLWCVIISLAMWKYDPALMARRQSAGPRAEQTPNQRRIMTFASVAFLATVLVPALDKRFGWSQLPLTFVVLGHVLLAGGFYGFYRTFRDNTFAASTIVVEQGQRVVDTGLYAWVRHPMYAAAVPMFAGIPLALGSWWGLIPALALGAAIIWRLLDEERYLAVHLPGYADYCRKVRCRLVPGLW